MDLKTKKVAVIGGGSWATAISKILLNNVDHIYWWVRELEVKDGLHKKGKNPLYLTSVEFSPTKISVSNDIKEIISLAEVLIFVIPSAFFVNSLEGIEKKDLENKIICSAVKGILPETNNVVGEYFNSNLGIDLGKIAIISGPSHAEEIALGRLTYLTAASSDASLADSVAKLFACSYVRTLTSNDIFGIEYAAVLKNIYALSVGISKGLNYGDNFVSALVANALNEMSLFLNKIHPLERNLLTSPYLGDLLVTSYSQFSRNRTFGNMIGQGYSVKSAILEMKMVSEGYYASYYLQQIKKGHIINMPIFESVHDILYENKSAKEVFKKLELFLV